MSNSIRAIELNKSCDNQEIELNKIHNMDCLEFMKTVPDNFFFFFFCDIPYIIYDKTFSFHFFLNIGKVHIVSHNINMTTFL